MKIRKNKLNFLLSKLSVETILTEEELYQLIEMAELPLNCLEWMIPDIIKEANKNNTLHVKAMTLNAIYEVKTSFQAGKTMIQDFLGHLHLSAVLKKQGLEAPKWNSLTEGEKERLRGKSMQGLSKWIEEQFSNE